MAAPPDLPARLLMAAARSYIRAYGLDRADPLADPEQYARWLGETRHQADDGVLVEVPLGDLLAAVATIRRLEAAARHHATEAGTFGRWIATLREAGDIMRDTRRGLWKTRAGLAVRALGLHGRRKDPGADADLHRDWWNLTKDPNGPRLSKLEALARLASDRYPRAEPRSAITATRKALDRAGVRRLPRI
jgi:hypothetical protein